MAWDDLYACVEGRLRRSASASDVSAFLSGERLPGSNTISSVWTNARKASDRLGVQWSVNDDRAVTLLLGESAITDRRAVCRTIRNRLRSARSSALKALPQQGKTFSSFSRSKVSSHYHSNGDYLRFTDWRFVHRARLGLVNLNAYNRVNPEIPRSCRRCGYAAETLPHVLCHCLPSMGLITKRHNRIVDRLRDAAAGRWQVFSENRPIGSESLRPDLVLTKDREAIIIDATVTFENGEDAFSSARQAKEAKYARLATELKGRFDAVRVEAIVVGALGSWDPRNDRVVARLCSKKYAKLMKRLIVSDTVRASRDLYVGHLTGVVQTDNRGRYGRSRVQPQDRQSSAQNFEDPNPSTSSSASGPSSPVTSQNPAAQQGSPSVPLLAAE